MTEILCEKKCCIARFCPLVVAYACTVHKFQGFEAGFDKGDTVHHIIADMNSLDWEKLNPGTAYVVTSRAKTIGTISGSRTYPMNSNIYFDGQISEYRFTKTLYKNSGEKCLHIKQRDAWVSFLNERAAETEARLTPDTLRKMKHNIETVTSSIDVSSKTSIQTRIMDMINEPNPIWKNKKMEIAIDT